jgi:glycosyltransferase involved in cell wall biosynthesis
MYHSRLPEEGVKPGGVAVFVHRLAAALAGRDHDVTVFTYGGGLPDVAYEVVRLRPAVAADSLLMRVYGAPWLFNLRPFGRRFDVAHMHGDDWFYWRRRLPTVRTFYGSALYESLTATSRKRRLNQAILFGLELAAAKRADAVYGIGTDSRVLFQADGILRTGIDVDTAERQPSERPVILFVGTWEGRKRGRFLQDVFLREVRPRVPGAELWMVADHAEPAEGVRWISAPTDAELADLFRRAWVFCLPSTYEGLGLPYMEAMGHGIPVVASPNPGAQDLLGDGSWGVVTEDETLGEELIRLLGDPAARESIAARGRERAAAFSWDRMLDQHERAYDLAVDRWAAKHR